VDNEIYRSDQLQQQGKQSVGVYAEHQMMYPHKIIPRKTLTRNVRTTTKEKLTARKQQFSHMYILNSLTSSLAGSQFNHKYGLFLVQPTTSSTVCTQFTASRVFTNLAKWKSPSFPGFPEPLNSYFQTIIKRKP